MNLPITHYMYNTFVFMLGEQLILITWLIESWEVHVINIKYNHRPSDSHCTDGSDL